MLKSPNCFYILFFFTSTFMSQDIWGGDDKMLQDEQMIEPSVSGSSSTGMSPESSFELNQKRIRSRSEDCDIRNVKPRLELIADLSSNQSFERRKKLIQDFFYMNKNGIFFLDFFHFVFSEMILQNGFVNKGIFQRYQVSLNSQDEFYYSITFGGECSSDKIVISAQSSSNDLQKIRSLFVRALESLSYYDCDENDQKLIRFCFAIFECFAFYYIDLDETQKKDIFRKYLIDNFSWGNVWVESVENIDISWQAVLVPDISESYNISIFYSSRSSAEECNRELRVARKMLSSDISIFLAYVQDVIDEVVVNFLRN